jgi:hypothetical protein
MYILYMKMITDIETITYDVCKEQVLLHNSKKILKSYEKHVYDVIINNNWIELFDLIKPKHKTLIWTKENCKTEALKYQYKSDFTRKSNGAYKSAFTNGWIDDICSHMTKKPQKVKKLSYYQRNKELIEKRWIENREHRLNVQRQYRLNNLETVREKVKLFNREYRKIKKDEVNDHRRQRYRNKKVDPIYRIATNLRTLIRTSIINQGYKKGKRTQQILGCTFEEFKLHIESQFEPWMSWDNYGNWNGIPTERNTSWDIDHKIPSSHATTEEEIYSLNHYSNLQPLCSYFNRYTKSNRFIS